MENQLNYNNIMWYSEFHNGLLDHQYVSLGIQYYLLAWVGSRFPFIHSSGTLYLLGFELLIKSYLKSKYSAHDLQYTYGHNLVKLWAEFKSEIADTRLDKFDLIIKKIIKDCYDKIISIVSKEYTVGVLATVLFHYLLTNSLIISQRKVEFQGIELDIVIPDIRTLEKDPKKTLLIYIAKSTDQKIIQEKVTQLEKIQPEKENIWVVLSEDINVGKKSFVLDKENNSFTKIIFEIAQFSNVSGTNKFKILRI